MLYRPLWMLMAALSDSLKGNLVPSGFIEFNMFGELDDSGLLVVYVLSGC